MSDDPNSRDFSQPPLAERRESVRLYHGDAFNDPYEWLRDTQDRATIAYLEAENAFTEQATAHLDPLRDELFEDIAARTLQTDLSVPEYASHSGPQARCYWYYSRTKAGANYPSYCRVPGLPDSPPDPDGASEREEVLLDCNAEAEGLEFFSLGSFSVSPDGRLLAYAVDGNGAERYRLQIKDLHTGALLDDRIENTVGPLAWAGDDHLFFLRADEAWRPHELWRHRVGGNSELVYTEPDERFWMSVDESRARDYVVVSLGSKLTGEVRLLPSATPTAPLRVVAPRREGLDYQVEVAGDRLLILHNQQAQDYELAEARLDASAIEDWHPVLPHRPGVRLSSVDAYADFVVVGLRRDGLTGVQVLPRDAAGNLQAGWDLQFDEPLYTAYPSGSPEYRTDRLRLQFTSLVTPLTVQEHNLRTGERTVLKRVPVQDHPVHGAYRSEDYVQERTWARAEDGTAIPMSLVRRKDVARDGTAPALLYGYGSYEVSTDPWFSIARLSLLDRGFVFAIAHVRGGGELGRNWYDDGKMMQKRNTFTDFIACARHLIDEGYTCAQRLGAQGGSAGGLLMGAVANLAPDLFGAIHAMVPFVDCLTTILKPELPLTVTEWEEWGDPLHDPQVYAYLKSYAPYENVGSGNYPAILATTSLNDTRVLYVEPAKWVAALRANAANGRTGEVLLKTEMTAGHGGVSGRYNVWRDTAFEYAWLIDRLTGY